MKRPKAFISNMGSHTVRSMGKDMKLDKVGNVKNLSNDSFATLHENVKTWADILATSGLKTGERIAINSAAKIVDRMINNTNEQSYLTHQNKISGLGKNDAIYLKTNAHIGIPTSKRLKNMSSNNPMVSFVEKCISSSSKDYQKHEKRRNLVLSSGFDEKNFSFFMEDTYFTVNDWLSLYKKDPKIEKNIKRIKNGRVDVYGCIYYTKLQLKFTNHFDYYSAVCKLHLIKINDIHDDLRSLIAETTNNKTNIINIEPNKKKEKKKTNLRETAKKIGEDVVDELIDQSNINVNWKGYLKDKIKTLGTIRGHAFGKLPEDSQYSDPNIEDNNNRFCINLLTSIDTKLTDSVQFNDRAHIIKTWYHIIPAGSIWEFNLTQHYGKGIHLNYIFDLDELNLKHPSSYVLVMEFNGDRRAKLIKKSTNDTYVGISPSRLHCEFKHSLGMLVEDKDGYDEEDGKPCVYRTKKSTEDFEEKSEFYKIFTPDRESNFHVPIENIELLESKAGSPKEDEKEYVLEYDSVISTSDNILRDIKKKFSDHGLKTDDLTADDAIYNPSDEIIEEEYEGTEGQNITDILDE